MSAAESTTTLLNDNPDGDTVNSGVTPLPVRDAVASVAPAEVWDISPE